MKPRRLVIAPFNRPCHTMHMDVHMSLPRRAQRKPTVHQKVLQYRRLHVELRRLKDAVNQWVGHVQAC